MKKFICFVFIAILLYACKNEDYINDPDCVGGKSKSSNDPFGSSLCICDRHIDFVFSEISKYKYPLVKDSIQLRVKNNSVNFYISEFYPPSESRPYDYYVNFSTDKIKPGVYQDTLFIDWQNLNDVDTIAFDIEVVAFGDEPCIMNKYARAWYNGKYMEQYERSLTYYFNKE